MVEFRVGPDDLLRCRFAISPLWETVAALRVALQPDRQTVHTPWLRRHAGQLEGLPRALLQELLPAEGESINFLTPPPRGPLEHVNAELERVRATPVEVVRAELARALTSAGGPGGGGTRSGGPSPEARDLLADPAGARDRIAGLLGECWCWLLADDWPRVRDLLEGDVLFRARRLADRGIEGFLADLHPAVSWSPATIHVTRSDASGPTSPSTGTGTGDRRFARRLDLGGRGLLFMPSVFSSPTVAVILDRPWQPTLVYPARGVALLWDRPASPTSGLIAMLGRTRAALLADLTAPSSPSRLAARHAISLASASEHLGVLRAAGLATAHRAGRQVLYELTPLGHALVAAEPVAPSRRGLPLGATGHG